MPRNFLDCQNEVFSSLSQPHSNSSLVFDLNCWYQANVKTRIVKPIRYGLKGSINEKVDAIPLVPANSANTGVIQHKEAVIAARTEVPINFLLLFMILFQDVFILYQTKKRIYYYRFALIERIENGLGFFRSINEVSIL